MSLIKKVLLARSTARLNQDQSMSILTLLVGELETRAKRDGLSVEAVADADVLTVVRKLIKSNVEVISLVTEDRAEKFIEENKILSAYLPVEMSDEAVEAALTELVFGNVGEAIKGMDAKYAGLYNKATACKIAKNLL